MVQESNKLDAFLNRTTQILGISIDEVRGLFEHKKSVLRLNTLKPDIDEKKDEILKSFEHTIIPFCANAYFIVSGRDRLTASDLYKGGYFYIQNASSLIPPIVLDPKSGDVVLDMCAAPGGKTIQIAEISNNESFIYVNDESYARLGIMKQLIKSHGVNIVHFFTQPAQFLTKHTKQTFDKILIDAPCSGEGLINLNSENPMEYWSGKKIERLSRLQKNILSEAYKLLNSGGTIVYSTCTLAPEENEANVDFFLNKFTDMHLQNINIEIENKMEGLTEWKDEKFTFDTSNVLRIIPNEYFRPFFVAKFVKK